MTCDCVRSRAIATSKLNSIQVDLNYNPIETRGINNIDNQVKNRNKFLQFHSYICIKFIESMYIHM